MVPMYPTNGVTAVATITELRADTAELVEASQKTGEAILIQKNNRPYAVMISWETYQQVKDLLHEVSDDADAT